MAQRGNRLVCNSLQGAQLWLYARGSRCINISLLLWGVGGGGDMCVCVGGGGGGQKRNK